MNKFIVITSIFDPTEAVKKFAKFSDWQLIVVGDRKTPKNFSLKNVVYLSPDDQLRLFPKIAKELPWNSYSRKNLGYLYAIRRGADIIADSDDDNIPYKNWGKGLVFQGEFNTIYNEAFVNIYRRFTNKFIWPRGYPLNRVLETRKIKIKRKKSKVGVWQFLVDLDPDVDAIYRLVLNNRVRFTRKGLDVLEKNTVCPFNSQNTFFIRELFPLLFLPPFVSMRFTDILRGLVAQPIMWNCGYHLGFGYSTAMQKRNPHDFLKDFELEIPFYLNTENIVSIAMNAVYRKDALEKNIENVYKALVERGVLERQVLSLLKLWIEELHYEKSY